MKLMTYNAQTLASKWAVRVLLAGLVCGTSGTVVAQYIAPYRPAAKLELAQARYEPTTTRGQNPEPVPNGNYTGPVRSYRDSGTPPWVEQNAPANTRPTATEKPKESSLIGRGWKDLKNKIIGPPIPEAPKQYVNAPTPKSNPANQYYFPNVPRSGAPTATTAPKQANNSNPIPTFGGRAPGQSGPAVAGPKGGSPNSYAAAPAYRWYGWGTTTPGQNAYAPEGNNYPAGSAKWFAHSGATPGAFPVTGNSPVRVPDGAQAPGYPSQPPAPPVFNHNIPVQNTTTTITPPPGPMMALTSTPIVATVPTVTPPPSNQVWIPLHAEPANILPTISSPPAASAPMVELNPPATGVKEISIPPAPAAPVVPSAPVVTNAPLPPTVPQVPVVKTEPEPTWAPAKPHVPPPTVELIPSSPKVSNPAVIPSSAKIPVEPEPMWQTAKSTPAPIPAPVPTPVPTPIPAELPATVAKQTAPVMALAPIAKTAPAAVSESKLMALEKQVREHAKTQVTIQELISVKPGKITVKFAAANELIAEKAAKDINDMPALKGYELDFEATVSGR